MFNQVKSISVGSQPLHSLHQFASCVICHRDVLTRLDYLHTMDEHVHRACLKNYSLPKGANDHLKLRMEYAKRENALIGSVVKFNKEDIEFIFKELCDSLPTDYVVLPTYELVEDTDPLTYLVLGGKNVVQISVNKYEDGNLSVNFKTYNIAKYRGGDEIELVSSKDNGKEPHHYVDIESNELGDITALYLNQYYRGTLGASEIPLEKVNQLIFNFIK